MLKSKILGIRATARDKKKKRKQKKKNNKLISQQHFGLVEKNKDKSDNMNNKFCRSIQNFSYIVSNGTVIKESSSNNQSEINFENNKCSISSDKINKIKKFDKNIGLKKINSVNEINIQNNIKKESKDFNNKEKANSNEEESDELFNYIASKKTNVDKITKRELENIFDNYKLGVDKEDLEKMMNYMANSDETEQNEELLVEENEEDEEENKIEEIKKKKKINSVTREQFKKFYTEKK